MICGRRCSLLCLFMSTWGFLMLIVLGACFSFNSLVLVGDLPLADYYTSPDNFKDLADAAYGNVALRCFITGILFLVIMVISLIAFHRDNKRRKRLYKKRKQQR